jgi:hypothetical protein
MPVQTGIRCLPFVKATMLRGLALLRTLAAVTLGAADISSSGNWTEMIDASDLVAGAGSDVASQYESGSGTATLTISNTAGASWRILARRSDGTWHNNFVLSVRRTSDGSGSGAVIGGSSYIQLSTLDTEIFSGSGDRSSIAVQYKLTGMSKNVSPNLYSSGITFVLLLP